MILCKNSTDVLTCLLNNQTYSYSTVNTLYEGISYSHFKVNSSDTLLLLPVISLEAMQV